MTAWPMAVPVVHGLRGLLVRLWLIGVVDVLHPPVNVAAFLLALEDRQGVLIGPRLALRGRLLDLVEGPGEVKDTAHAALVHTLPLDIHEVEMGVLEAERLA